MVSSRDFKQAVKKKPTVSSKDQEEWLAYTKKMSDITFKDEDVFKQKLDNRVPKLDLHGLSLNQANKEVKKFIIESFTNRRKKIVVITGKGSRSKSYNNPYISEKLSILKNSIPDYISRNKELMKKISKISKASLKNGDDGAIYIFLKK